MKVVYEFSFLLTMSSLVFVILILLSYFLMGPT
jgi:hypothetical protein